MKESKYWKNENHQTTQKNNWFLKDFEGCSWFFFVSGAWKFDETHIGSWFFFGKLYPCGFFDELLVYAFTWINLDLVSYHCFMSKPVVYLWAIIEIHLKKSNTRDALPTNAWIQMRPKLWNQTFANTHKGPHQGNLSQRNKGMDEHRSLIPLRFWRKFWPEDKTPKTPLMIFA